MVDDGIHGGLVRSFGSPSKRESVGLGPGNKVGLGGFDTLHSPDVEIAHRKRSGEGTRKAHGFERRVLYPEVAVSRVYKLRVHRHVMHPARPGIARCRGLIPIVVVIGEQRISTIVQRLRASAARVDGVTPGVGENVVIDSKT